MTGGAIGSLIAQMLAGQRRRAQDAAGRRRRRRHDDGFGTPIAAIMLAVELLLFEWRRAASFPSRWPPSSRRSSATLLAAGAALPVRRRMRRTRVGARWLGAVGLLSGLVVGRADAAGLRVRGRLSEAADPLDVVADARRPGRWHRRPDRSPRARRRLRQHRRDAARDDLPAPRCCCSSSRQSSGRWRWARDVGWRARAAADHGRRAWARCSAHVLPAASPGFWALLAMAATMGGTMRSPLTATFFAVELTGNTHVLLPLIAACVTAQVVTVLLMRRSILTEKVARRGHHSCASIASIRSPSPARRRHDDRGRNRARNHDPAPGGEPSSRALRPPSKLPV